MPQSPHRVLLIPSRSDVGPYRSLERVEQSTRAALAAAFDVVAPTVHPSDDKGGFLEAFATAPPVDAIIDLSDYALHGPLTPTVPTLFYALGNMPNGATLAWLRRPRLKTTDVILMNCQSDLAIHEATLAGTGPRGELLPLGVDTGVFRPRPEDRAATRKTLGVPNDAFVLLYAGRLNVQKNIHSLLLVLREFVTLEPRAHLVLAGEPDHIAYALFDVTNEGYADSLRQLIHGWGLDDHVHFPGKLGDEDLARTYAAADVFITLTLHNNENFGYAPVEAMACGTPVVGTHFGGIKDTVIHNETGFHVETLITDHGLRACWRQAIQPLVRLAGEPQLRDRLGAAGRTHVQQHYSIEVFNQRLAHVVTTAISRAKVEVGRPGSTFRFSQQAMDLHLRNLYRTYLRSEGKKRERTGMRVPYHLYRWFQGPYTTRDVAPVELNADDTIALIPRCRLDRKAHTLTSLDPIWGRTYELTVPEIDLVSQIEPGVRVAELLGQTGTTELTPAAAKSLLSRLLLDGVIFFDRPFQAD